MAVYVSICVCGSQRSTSGVFLHIFVWGVSLNLEFNILARIANQRAPGIHLPLLQTATAGMDHTAQLLCGASELRPSCLHCLHLTH